MSRPRVALVVNPAAGVGRAARLAEPVAARLRAGAEVTVLAGASVAATAAQLAGAGADHDAVVLLGGDGLVHLAAQHLAGGVLPVGIVPAGTGNDVADTLAVPREPLAAADAMLAAVVTGSARRIDLGRTDAGRWWVTVLCAGFDSAVTETANRLRRPRGPRRYDVAIAVEFARLRAHEFDVRVDDTELTGRALLVAVGNGPQYGGGKRIAHGADLADGRFLVTHIAPVPRREFARLAPTLPRAGHVHHPAVTMLAGRRVRMAAPGTVAYADGERIGPLPVTTECVPGALPVLVPPP